MWVFRRVRNGDKERRMMCWLGRISMGGGVWAGGGLGWIVATPGGQIFFFLGSSKKSPEVSSR